MPGVSAAGPLPRRSFPLGGGGHAVPFGAVMSPPGRPKANTGVRCTEVVQ